MSWPFSIRNAICLQYPKEYYIWAKIKIIHETNKAILTTHNSRKFWIPKSRIYKIRLKNNTFEIYTKENTLK